jgi:hypothetical protein
MLWPLIPVALALRLPLPVVCLAATVGFLGVLAFNDLLHTVIHKMIPEDVLSRVVAYDYFLGDLALPIGILLAGPTANAFGARGTLAGAGVLVLVVLMATMLVPSVRNFTVDTAAPGPRTSRAKHLEMARRMITNRVRTDADLAQCEAVVRLVHERDGYPPPCLATCGCSWPRQGCSLRGSPWCPVTSSAMWRSTRRAHLR